MNGMQRLAHISEDGREQSILEHLTGTAGLCAGFAAAFGAEEQGQLAGLAHDIGKYSAAFQRRLAGGPKVDHSTAGAFECLKCGQPLAAFAVAGHHSGLPDGGGQGDTSDQPTFCGRMKRGPEGKLESYSAWTEELSLPTCSPVFPGQNQAEGMFFTRMLYSCLVDADFLDTETFMAGAPTPRGSGETLNALEQKLLTHISGWFPPQSPLNEQRCAVLERCLEQGEAQRPGLYTLTIPTGGGKTVASLAFALRHANTHGLRRIIYVVPYTSIIEQNAQVFRNILGEGNVLEHHSGVLCAANTEEASPASIRLEKAAENWDMPVVVTTAVQFFESLYAARSSSCRKLHNIAGSVVIFDEAQMLPIPYLRPCVFAIAQLVKRFRVSAVLCTATQPALNDIFHEFVPEFPAVELCPQGTYQKDLFRRITFRQAGKRSWEELSEELNRLQHVLCIVNSRKNAQELFSRLEPEGAFHLSTLMYPAHRKAVLDEIRARLKSGLTCRVVSTSLIEAGVDVDFPAVFREEAGLDSILQAAGRCNREGKRPPEECPVIIFQAENTPPPLFAVPIASEKETMKHYDQPDSQEAVAYYFQCLLNMKGPEALDQKDILPLMQEDRSFMPFRTVDERFHLIDSATRAVCIPRGDGKALGDCLRNGERSRSLFRELGQYSVSVYENHFQALWSAGDLELLDDGTAILSNVELYSETMGLSLETDSGKAYFV